MSADRIATLRAEDARARLLAQSEFERPLVLVAGAGTGKTSTLVARVVAWCLGEGWERAQLRAREGGASDEAQRPDRIAADVLARVVAITFTEAAAAEMADRIGEALAAIESGAELPVGVQREALPADAAQLAQRARALHGALERLVVRTIHAFCRRLLAEHPLAAGLHPRFQVDADGRAQAQAVREVVERALREAYRGAPDAALVQLAADGFGPTAVEETLLGLVAAGALAEELQSDWLGHERLRGFGAALHESALAMRDADRGRFLALKGRTLATAEAVERSLEISAEPPRDELAFASMLQRLREEWSDKSVARLRTWGNGTFLKGEGKAIVGDEQRIAACASALHPLLVAALRIDVTRLRALREGLGPLLRKVEEVLRERGVATYDALLRGARDLLRRNPALCAQLRRGIDQLLVDEFQDTDPLQCDIVRALALEGPEEDRPCLFLVGDPKQSIYGWRNADLRAYANFVEEMLAAGGERHALSVNFRSVPTILRAVERAIEPVMREQPGLQPAFEPLVPSQKLEGEVGFERGGRAAVECWVSWLPDAVSGEFPAKANAESVARAEAEAIARDLRELRDEHGLAWRDAAILLRGMGDIDHYLGALREHGVPYAVARERSYYRRREVIEAVALVRCVLDPHDQLALLSMLRSSAVGVPDAALIPLWTREFPRRVGELHGDASHDEELLAELRAAVHEVAEALPEGIPGLDAVRGWEYTLIAALEALGPLRQSFESDPPDRFVERLRISSGFELAEAGRHLGGFRIANLERFFRELARDLAADVAGGAAAMGDEQAVLRRLRRDVAEQRERLEEPVAAAEDAVQVMTMHAAKGLEFEHVYLPQLHKGSGRGFGLLEVGRSEQGLELRVQRPLGTQTLGFGAWEMQRERVGRAEQVRSLYVAATRAKQRLVLLASWPQAAPAPQAEAPKTHVDLLAIGGFAPDELVAAAAQRVAEWTDAEGVRWRFPALAGDAAAQRRRREAAVLPPTERVVEDAVRLSALRADATQHAARPWRAAASSSSQHEVFEARAARRYGESAADAEREPSCDSVSPRDLAMDAGNLVHRALEEFDFGSDPSEEIARQRARLPALAEAAVGAVARDALCEKASEILDAFARGPLLERFAALRDSVVARELPVWLAPPCEGAAGNADPVGALAGVLDLVYRDARGEWVVADYKTDRVESSAALVERARSYAAQGAVYTRALREGLGLESEPRFELWFLRAGKVVDAAGADLGFG